MCVCARERERETDRQTEKREEGEGGWGVGGEQICLAQNIAQGHVCDRILCASTTASFKMSATPSGSPASQGHKTTFGAHLVFFFQLQLPKIKQS